MKENQNKELEKSLFSNRDFMIKKRAEGPFYDLVRSFCKIQKGQKILEVGCGTGVYGIDMARCGGDVVGLDISPEAIDFANSWAKKEKLSFKGVIGDAENLPFKESTFDLVFFGALLHHFPKPEKALLEAKRVLNKTGKVVLVEPNGNNPVLRLSRFLAEFLPIKYANDIHATKNETIHTRSKYVKILKNEGFVNNQITYFKRKPDHKTTVTNNLVLKIAIKLKIFALAVMALTFPPIGYEYILISSTKQLLKS